MKRLFLFALALPMAACASARAPGAAGEAAPCNAPTDATLAAQAHGDLAGAAAAQGPEASTTQGRKSVTPSGALGVNRSQSGDNTTTSTSFDGSATVSAGAPAVVQTLFGAIAGVSQSKGGDSDEVIKAFSDELAGVRTRALATADPVERARLDARADAILATIKELALARNVTAATAAAAPAPTFPNLTTVVFTNASGSSAGSDKPAVDPKNAEAIATGVPALVEKAKAKP